ncbi:MAG: S8 family serine peptidase [Cellulomonas sp.]
MIDEHPSSDSALDVTEATVLGEQVPVVARRVVVQLAATDPVSSTDDLVAAALATLPPGSQVVRGPSATGRLVVLLPEGTDLDAAISDNSAAVEAEPAVAYVEPDVIDRAQVVPNDPRYPQQWAPPAVNAEATWDLVTGTASVLIGVIDSGISMSGGVLDHDDLNDTSRITLGTDFVDGGTPMDLHGHGTHVVGIAAAAGNNAAGVAGMNWGSPVYVCRTLDAGGNGSGADFADAVEEITDHAVALGIKAVINYSGGGADAQVKRDACQYASDHGMLVVAAAGNDNAGPVIFPAAYSTTIAGVIAVGSTDQGDTVSSFSNVGPEVTVVAPGRNILSTLPTYATGGGFGLNYGQLSGTSMATPLVTGLAALMWSRHPGHSNVKVKQCLEDTAVKLGAGSFDNSWGHGRVDALAAVKCGDLVIVPSILRCPPSRLRCPSVITLCPPSRLPVLCRTRLNTVCTPFTRLSTDCEIASAIRCPSQLACPSFVDGCPSSLGCDSAICGFPTEIDPTVLEATILRGGGPVIRTTPNVAGLGRLRGIRDRLTEGGATAPSEGAGWYYVDDDGTAHEV